MVQIEDKLADIELLPSKSLMSKAWITLLLIAAVLIAITTIIVSYYISKARNESDLDVQISTTVVGMSVFFSVPVMSMIAASILSFIPIRPYRYKQKYWVITLVTALIFEFFVFLATWAMYMYNSNV